jgi:hypothetical protein
MNRAAAQLAFLKEHHQSAVDRQATILAQVIDEQVGIMFAARMDRAFALMNGFRGSSAADLKAYLASRTAQYENVVRSFGEVVPDDRFARTSVGVAPTMVPTAFALHSKLDDSYAVGIDDGLFDMLNVLTLAAVAAFRAKDLNLYAGYCIHAFGLFYHVPQPSIVSAFEQLAKTYTDSAAQIRAMMDDMRVMNLRFVLSHETAHIALGHFEDRKPTQFSFDPQVQDSEVSAFDGFAEEFQADARAAEVMVLQAGDNPRALFAATQAPTLTLTLLKHIGVLARDLEGLNRIMRRHHPPEVERRARLREMAKAHRARPDAGPDLILQIADFIDPYDGPNLSTSDIARFFE